MAEVIPNERQIMAPSKHMDYPTSGAQFAAETGKSRFTAIIDTLPESVRTTAALYAQRQMNMVPGERPSDAAKSAVRAFNEGRLGRTA